MHEDDQRYTKTYPISWDQLHRDSRALAWRLLSIQRFKGIVAVTRGGLVPAAIIARELELRLVDTVCISSYDWQAQSDEAQILKSIPGSGRDWLIIDDLVDTGKTASIVRDMLPEAHFATVYAKPAKGSPVWVTGICITPPRLTNIFCALTFVGSRDTPPICKAKLLWVLLKRGAMSSADDTKTVETEALR